jgi:hypothetical protein
MAVDESKRRFGLPWTRGLTSATSLANSGWTDERKAKAREVAEKSQFFKFAHLTARRELAPFLKVEAIEHLGVNAKAVGKKFDERVRALAAKGLSIQRWSCFLRQAVKVDSAMKRVIHHEDAETVFG